MTRALLWGGLLVVVVAAVYLVDCIPNRHPHTGALIGLGVAGWLTFLAGLLRFPTRRS